VNMETKGRIIFGWLVESWHNLWELMAINFLWVLFTLLVVTAPPAAGGLYYAANRLAHEKPATWRTFFEGFRMHFWLSLRWGFLNLLALLVCISNVSFYRQYQAAWSEWLRGLFLVIGLLWCYIQVYTFPLLLEQEDQRLITAMRNSLVLYIKRPGLALVVATFILGIIFLTILYAWPTWIVITASLLAFLANHATIYLLSEINDPIDVEG